MGSEQVGFPQRGEDRKEGFGAADFFAEIFECVGKRVAHGVAERPQAERVQENCHLVSDPHDTVLEVAVVEAEAGVDEDFFYAGFFSERDLA